MAGKSPPPGAAANIQIVILFVSAAMLVVLGTVLPRMVELDEPVATVLSIALYVAAAGDVAIALWFRSKLKKARAAEQRGTVQRR